MRALTCALVLGLAVGFSGCKKKEVTEEPPEEAPAAPAAPAVKPQPATPEPKPVAAATPPPQPAATPAPELAPPGVFYLVTAVSVETSDGILGLKPGQVLKEVRPGVYKAGTNELTLRPDQVTNDLTIARRVATQDQQEQAAIQQRLAAVRAASAAASAASAANTPTGSTSPAAAQQVSPSVAARQELMQKKKALMAQVDEIATTLNRAAAPYGGNWAMASKKSPVCYQLFQQYNGLEKQIGDVNNQLSQIH